MSTLQIFIATILYEKLYFLFDSLHVNICGELYFPLVHFLAKNRIDSPVKISFIFPNNFFANEHVC